MTAHAPATWIKQPSAVFTANDLDAAGGIVVREDRIVELVGRGKEPETRIDSVVDASGRVLLPGLINGHHHFYQTLTRAYPTALNKPLFDWLKTLYPVWANLTEEAVAISTRLALAELMLSGCTTASDHHYLFSSALTQAIDVQTEEAAKLGMRVVLTRGSMSLSVEDGGLPPRSVTESEHTILAESERLIGRYHDGAPHAMCQIALAPCSPFSVTRELMRETAQLARAHGVRLHTHLAETRDENDFCVAKFGMRPLDYLEDVDWLADDVWLAHGIHFTQAEMNASERPAPASATARRPTWFWRLESARCTTCSRRVRAWAWASTAPRPTIAPISSRKFARLCSSAGSDTARSLSPTSPSCGSPPAEARICSAAPN